MAQKRKNYKSDILHERKDKKTSIAGTKSRVKTSSMSKNRKSSYKAYRGQGR